MNEKQRREIASYVKIFLGDGVSLSNVNFITRTRFRIKSCNLVDSMRLIGSGRALTKLISVKGLDHIEEALAGGKGAILCSSHFGSFSSSFSVLGALGFPVTLIARFSSSDDHRRPMLLRLFHRLLRGRPVKYHFSRPVIENRPETLGVAVKAATALRQNELVGILLDSPAKSGDLSRPIAVSYLNRKFLMTPGAVKMAQLTGAPLMMMLMYREPDFRHQVIEISPPVSTTGDTMEIFIHCLRYLEARIRTYPAHVAWVEG